MTMDFYDAQFSLPPEEDSEESQSSADARIVRMLADAMWSQTPHGDSGDLDDLPVDLQNEYLRRSANVLRRLTQRGVRFEIVDP